MVNWSLDNFLGKRRRTEEEVSILLEPYFFPTFLVFPSQTSDIQEVLSLILHCKTMHCCLMTSPSTSATSGTLTTCTPSSRADWLQEGTGSQCFSQPWTRCTPIKIGTKSKTIWANQESRCTKIRGEFTKIQYIGAIWSSLEERDCSSIKLDRTKSLFSTHFLRFVLRKVVYMKTGEDSYCKVHQFPRLPRNMDVRILPIPKRENPPTIKANRASSTGKLVAHFSRTHVAGIPEKVSDGSAGKPVAVTLITEFQVFLTQPSRKKTRIARKQSKNWLNSSRITRTGTRSYRIWTRLKISIRSAKSRRSWSPAWATRNTSSCARLLLRYSALIALYIGKRA